MHSESLVRKAFQVFFGFDPGSWTNRLESIINDKKNDEMKLKILDSSPLLLKIPLPKIYRE
jgi:hypothetical protein